MDFSSVGASTADERARSLLSVLAPPPALGDEAPYERRSSICRPDRKAILPTGRYAGRAICVPFAWQGWGVEAPVEIRDSSVQRIVARVGEIDRTERIDVLFEQHGTELVARRGSWSASAWDPDGHGENSVDAKRQALMHYADAGGIARGAFSGGRLVGIGVVVPDIRPAIAQLAFLHVSHDFRAAGVGGRLSADLELVARRTGDTEIVVSATPSENTVRFYLGRGYRPMARPLPELLELEPEDVHMGKVI